jgi:hypothetical protein
MTISATPDPDTIIKSELATCVNCRTPIVSLAEAEWMHAFTGKPECPPDPRSDPPQIQFPISG